MVCCKLYFASLPRPHGCINVRHYYSLIFSEMAPHRSMLIVYCMYDVRPTELILTRATQAQSAFPHKHS